MAQTQEQERNPFCSPACPPGCGVDDDGDEHVTRRTGTTACPDGAVNDVARAGCRWGCCSAGCHHAIGCPHDGTPGGTVTLTVPVADVLALAEAMGQPTPEEMASFRDVTGEQMAVWFRSLVVASLGRQQMPMSARFTR